MSVQKIGIITSGGDCGGLNGVIKGAAATANARGIEPYLIPNGYAGLYNLVDFEKLTRLTAERLAAFHVYMAGSEAGNSRVKISKIKDENKYNRIKAGMQKFGLNALIIAGGDDTGSVVVDLASNGVPCVHAPKTMDLDLMPYSVGGDSTINRIADFIRDLKTTGTTHNRVIVMEVFGRYAGHTAFRGGIAGEADAILIPEIVVNFDIVYEHVKKVFFKRVRESDNHAGAAMVIVAEGLRDSDGNELVDKNAEPDSFGHRPLVGAGKYVVNELSARLKKDADVKEFMQSTKQLVSGLYETPEVREIRPSHLVRCGYTSAYDASFGLQVGSGALELVRKGIFGVTVANYQNGNVDYMDCAEAIQQRYVSLEDVMVFENMGINFGRKPGLEDPALNKVSGRPVRLY
ncbi:MAG: 6-phosphofructokinase [Leptospiraceae bacterium]|nr:6-phosphofructokinase [Leptospiraceae bacterium]